MPTNLPLAKLLQSRSWLFSLDNSQVRSSVLASELTLAGTSRRNNKRPCVGQDFNLFRISVAWLDPDGPSWTVLNQRIGH
jgi:hypothetical protein